MYFSNEVHEKNYQLAMKKYRLKKGENVQEEASLYIASFPKIFEAIQFEGLGYNCPLLNLTKWNTQLQRVEFVSLELTGSTKKMCELGLSLYNGHSIDLNEVFSTVVDRTMIQVLLQAIKIRARH